MIDFQSRQKQETTIKYTDVWVDNTAAIAVARRRHAGSSDRQEGGQTDKDAQAHSDRQRRRRTDKTRNRQPKPHPNTPHTQELEPRNNLPHNQHTPTHIHSI